MWSEAFRAVGLRSRILGIAIAGTLAVVAGLPAATDTSDGCDHPVEPGLGDRPWLVPFEFDFDPDPAAQQKAYYDFMWRTFIAINWPATGEPRGKPDCSKGIFDGHLNTERVWETYPGPLEVFLPPTDWNPYPQWGELEPPGAKRLGHHKIPPVAIVVNQPGTGNLALVGADDFPTGPLVDQNGGYVVYQVGINQAYFEYIRHFAFYDSESQFAAVEEYLRYPASPQAFQPPPSGSEAYLRDLPPYVRQGMIEIKAAWRDLAGVQHQDRYIRREVEVELIDVEPGKVVKRGKRLMGLVALHILRFTPNGRIAATFEQVDNVEVGHSAPEGLKPSLNDGEPPSPIQRLIGFENADGQTPSEIPPPISPSNPLKQDPEPVDIYRVTSIPPQVRQINAEYQGKLYRDSYSPLAYYQLIGTQNRHPGDDFSNRESNGHEGPITGVYTNANNLINTALESYTQKNFSCIGCHVAARPLGVTQASFGIDRFKVLSFLLRRACLMPGRPCANDSACCSRSCGTSSADGPVCSQEEVPPE